jgi:DNA (cytosine-5)-methyltransferase 1
VVDLNGLALCSGVGGLERGIESVFENYKTVCHVEGEAYAVACIISQMEKGWIHEAPVWSDLRTFDGSKWRGKVDVISSGFPCQPFSQAGNIKGIDDPRYLWPHVSRIIGEVRPSLVILENVPNVVEHVGTHIFGDLSEMGYCCSWGIVRASDAKAPHQRRRFFAVAIHTNTYNNGFPIFKFKKESNDNIYGARKLEGNRTERLCSNVSDSNSNSKPNLSFDDRKGGIVQEHFRIEEWKVEPRVARVADGVAYWMDRIRACGNGVVPQQAKLAIETLFKQLIDFIEDSKL